MESDMAKTLDLLREQNKSLLNQLKHQQSRVKSYLGTLNTTGLNSSNFPSGKIDMVSSVKTNVVETVWQPPILDGPANKRYLYHAVHDGHNSSNKENDSSIASECTMTDDMSSTPDRRLPYGVLTPQSILKRRKIIDNNVKVSSKFAHTPERPSRYRNLNFSYSDVNEDDIEMLKKVVRGQMDDGGPWSRNTAESETSSLSTNWSSSFDQSGSQELEQLMERRLLIDAGNDRTNASVVRDLSARPKSVVFDETAPQGRETFDESSSKSVSRRDLSSSSFMGTKVRGREGERPLLGYDFIAGLLDNESKLVDKSDRFYDELIEFRRVNKDECISRAHVEDLLDLVRPVSPDVKDPSHTCIHGYNVNDRLFPEPLNEDEFGRSVCPVCLSTRKEPTVEAPAFVRVSIPRSTLMTPYRVKPHRRRSFDESDNMALSKHCLAGWECSKPSTLPTASTVDLKQAADGLKAKLLTTVEDVEKMMQSHSRISKTEGLLDTSRAMRYDLQLLEMERGLNRGNPAHTTAYPI